MDPGVISSWLSGLSGAHALRFAREAERKAFFGTLLRSPCATDWWAVSADGGLLADFSLLENVLLPARARDDSRAGVRLWRWLGRLEAYGIAPPPLNRPLANLSLWQARVAGFLRAVVADAPALVFDDTCYGLSPAESRQAILLHGFFGYHFPFRPSVYTTLSAPPPELNISPDHCHRHDQVLA